MIRKYGIELQYDFCDPMCDPIVERENGPYILCSDLDQIAALNCHHENPYYDAEADNYYCSKCKKGMGQPYYNAMRRIAALETEKGRWRCYHCGFETSDKAAAEAHFGGEEGESSLCVEWSGMEGSEQMQAYQELTVELNETREENIALEAAMREKEEILLDIMNGRDKWRRNYDEVKTNIVSLEMDNEKKRLELIEQNDQLDAQEEQIAALKEELRLSGLRGDSLDRIVEQQAEEIKRLREALEKIKEICSNFDDYAPVNIKVGFMAQDALKEEAKR